MSKNRTKRRFTEAALIFWKLLGRDVDRYVRRLSPTRYEKELSAAEEK